MTKKQAVIEFVRRTGIAKAIILPLELDAVGITASWATIYRALAELRKQGELSGDEWVGREWVKPDEIAELVRSSDGMLLINRSNRQEIARALRLRESSLHNVMRWAVDMQVVEVNFGFYGDLYRLKRATTTSRETRAVPA